MTKQNFDINKLHVASPCSVEWKTMTGDERRRFCDLCQLNVYNFSEMTAQEVQKLIAGSEGRICGRLYKRADGTVLTKDCPVGLRAYQKRVSRFAGAVLPAILGMFSVSFGQTTDEKSIDASKLNIVRTVSRENILTGTIFDWSGAVIPNAEITVYNDKYKSTVKSDDEGVYKLPSIPTGIYGLEAKFSGFDVYKIGRLEIKNNEQVKLDIRLGPEAFVTMGDVVALPLVNPLDIKNLKLEKIKPKNSKKTKN